MLAPWPTGFQLDLHHQLDHALETAWMAFQPIRSRYGGVYGYEALLRSHSAVLRSPLDILEVAHHLRRDHDVGRVARQITAATAPKDFDLFVNVGPSELLDPVLGSEDCPLRPLARRVVLEITEQESLDVVPDLQRRLAALRRAGFRIAVDDYGAGHATLSSWSLVRPDILKVDRAIAGSLPGSLASRRMMEQTCDLAHAVGCLVVAEGIETEMQRAICVEIGCDLLQGYHLGRPVAPDLLPGS